MLCPGLGKCASMQTKLAECVRVRFSPGDLEQVEPTAAQGFSSKACEMQEARHILPDHERLVSLQGKPP